MTTVGRGRGWAKNTEEQSLRRPGHHSGQRDELIERIRGLNVSDVAAIKEPCSPAAEIVPDRTNLTNLTKLYHEALEDRTFIPKLVSIFLNPSNSLPGLLTLLQQDFEQREEFWRISPAKFMNFVCLMGEVLQPGLGTARNMIPHIASAIISLCKILLDSSGEDGIEILTNQICLNGERLNAAQPKELADLINHIRIILISKTINVRTRAMLLYVIDLSHSQYSISLEPDTQKCYDQYFSKETFGKLFNQRTPLLSNEAKPAENKISSKINYPNMTRRPEEKEAHNKPPPQGNQQRPRAIRGSGVNGSREDEKKNSRKSPSGNWSDGKKGWGHDDRFERDYQ